MSQNYDKLKSLLQELFQLDQPELDFGLYRVMHAKSAEISQFLDKDLLPQVQAAFRHYRTADKAAIEKELAQVIAGIETAGMDPAQSPKVNDLRERLKSDTVDVRALESEVYDNLFSFFRRYYSEGDFLAKRVYRAGVYAIPYEGEEVTLHWANKDQYYIKTSEYLRDYAFRLRPDDEQKPMRVHFRLTEAAEGEHGTVKATEGKGRVFILVAPGESGRDFISDEDGVQGKELVLGFEYRPATLADWPADVRAGESKPPAQKDLIALAVRRVLTTAHASLAGWLTELGRRAPTEKEPDRTVLEKHLKKYSDVNKFDYFIHKDLGSFLRRELDFYIKNEVMHLDDVESESAPRVDQYLSKIKVIRRIGAKIIDFLAQLEDFQKKLWLKKKFVVETQYCITLGSVPRAFYTEIAANDAQREEWVKLCAIDEIAGDLTTPGYGKPLAVGFLTAHPTLVVDTRHFDTGFGARLIEAMGDMDAQTDGVLFHSENFQALSALCPRYRRQGRTVYIDPPYNTGGDGFAYKDTYQRSSWAAMLADRLVLIRELLSDQGACFVSCDDNEQARCVLLMESVFGAHNFVTTMIWEGGRKNDAKQISVSHEYVVIACRDVGSLNASRTHWRTRKDGVDLIYRQASKLLRAHGTDYAAASEAMKEWYAALQDNNPSKRHARYFWIDSRAEGRGPYFADKIAGPDDGRLSRPRDVVHHPVTKKPVKMPSTGWCWEDIHQKVRDDLVHFGKDETTVPNKKTYLKDTEFAAPHSVIYKDGRAATIQLDAMIPNNGFANPKDVDVVAGIVGAASPPGSLVLDAFAGSGTTGHAVINLNREDGGRRKFVLIEMGGHFDTVLVPHLKKVAFSPLWKDGKPKRLATPKEAEGSPRIVKLVRLESYEDALNNLETRRTHTQQLVLDAAEARGADGLKEQYLLRYMLNVETRGSQSLLNVQSFTDPTAYKLKVKLPGSDESREVNVDLLETFNWLIGLTVGHIAAPQTFSAAFEHDSERRLRLTGRLKQEAGASYWFRTVTGTTPGGRKTLIIWRKLTGKPEQDNLVLEEWFTKQGYSAKDSEFDLIYVNGGNNLENLKTPDDNWKVRMIEEDFQRLMFETERV